MSLWRNRKNSHTFVEKLAISGAVYLAKYFSYLSMKTFFKRNASMGLSTISAKGGNLYHSGLIQRHQLGDIFLMFSRNQDLTFIISIDDDMYEIQILFFLGKIRKKKYFKFSSAEKNTQCVKH